jgi:hypothetical protein
MLGRLCAKNFSSKVSNSPAGFSFQWQDLSLNRSAGEPIFFQCLQAFKKNYFEKSGARHSDEHAEYAEEVATDQDRQQHEQGMQVHALGHDKGLN